MSRPTTPALDIIQARFARRYRITREEMLECLLSLHSNGELMLENDYVTQTMGNPSLAAVTWANMCQGITCISLWSGPEGCVRYDDPGSVHPNQMAEVAFVPATLAGGNLACLRRHAARVLLVSGDAV